MRSDVVTRFLRQRRGKEAPGGVVRRGGVEDVGESWLAGSYASFPQLKYELISRSAATNNFLFVLLDIKTTERDDG